MLMLNKSKEKMYLTIKNNTIKTHNLWKLNELRTTLVFKNYEIFLYRTYLKLQ